MMNNNTLLQSISNPSNFYTLGNAIYAYGKYNIPNLAGTLFIFYCENIPNNQFKSSLKHGRPPHHIKKTDGKIKKVYKKKGKYESIWNDIQDIKSDQIPKLKKTINFIENIYKIHYIKKTNSVITIQKYARMFLVKINIQKAKQMLIDGLDFKDDPITCEAIVNPIIITSDWSNKNKFIYDFSTIEKLALVERHPVYYIINENNQTQYYYTTIIKKDVLNNILYKSPMTRSLFIIDDIRYIKKSLWYQFGKLLQDK